MKLALSFSLLFVVSLVNQASALNVFEGVLSPQDIDELQDSKEAAKPGFFNLPKSVVDRLRNGAVSSYFMNVKHGVPVQARSISKTTNAHQDHHWDSGSIVDDEVAFFFLNSNPDAKFVHGTSQVDVKEGNMVQFSGNVPHNTVVKSGIVELAGPFHLSSMKPVGEGSACGNLFCPTSDSEFCGVALGDTCNYCLEETPGNTQGRCVQGCGSMCYTDAGDCSDGVGGCDYCMPNTPGDIFGTCQSAVTPECTEATQDTDCPEGDVCVSNTCIVESQRPPNAPQCGLPCDSDEECGLLSSSGKCTACLPEVQPNENVEMRCMKPRN